MVHGVYVDWSGMEGRRDKIVTYFVVVVVEIPSIYLWSWGKRV